MNKINKMTVLLLNCLTTASYAGNGTPLHWNLRDPSAQLLQNLSPLRRSQSDGDLLHLRRQRIPGLVAAPSPISPIMPSETEHTVSPSSLDIGSSAASSSAPTSILDMPLELIEQISLYAGPRATALLAATGRSFRGLVRNNWLWGQFRPTLTYDLTQDRVVPFNNEIRIRMTRHQSPAYQLFLGEMFHQASLNSHLAHSQRKRLQEEAIRRENPNAMMAVKNSAQFFYTPDGTLHNIRSRQARQLIVAAAMRGHHPDAYYWLAGEARLLGREAVMVRHLNRATDTGSERARDELIQYYRGETRDFAQPSVNLYLEWLELRFAQDPDFYGAHITNLLRRGRPREGLAPLTAEVVSTILQRLQDGERLSDVLREYQEER